MKLQEKEVLVVVALPPELVVHARGSLFRPSLLSNYLLSLLLLLPQITGTEALNHQQEQK